jgi:aspartate/methionine/tyrosine aminotransferase
MITYFLLIIVSFASEKKIVVFADEVYQENIYD